MPLLELSKEMLTVEGYLADAKLIAEKQLGKHINPDTNARFVIEIAQMLQTEHQHNLHKKPRPEKVQEKATPSRRIGVDRVMSEARSHPQVPPIVSASDDEVAVQPKRSHTRKSNQKPETSRAAPRSRKVDSKPKRVRPKAKTPEKSRRR
jgi:hypothetical protein